MQTTPKNGKGRRPVKTPTPVQTPGDSATTVELVTVEHGLAVTTTEAVARAASVQHKNVIALVREHLDDFREFGGVAFQTRSFATAGGHQSREVATLNEPQSALLLGKVERLDMRLLARGVPFADRKVSCRALVLEARGLLLRGAA